MLQTNTNMDYRAWTGTEMLYNVIPVNDSAAITEMQGLPPTATVLYRHDIKKIMQCSGLKDKNGKYIYVGDIFKFGSITNLVVFKHGMFCYESSVKGDFVCLYNHWFEWKNDQANKIEVIGNICQNPKLYKKLIS
jgi:uncharacterized phage protein (TIGR01671 family)